MDAPVPIPGTYRFRAWHRKRRLRWVWVLLAVSLVCYFLVSGDFGLYRIAIQTREKRALEREIAQLRDQNARLEEEIVLLQSDMDYVEKLARERYGMVKPGERLFRVRSQSEE